MRHIVLTIFLALYAGSGGFAEEAMLPMVYRAPYAGEVLLPEGLEVPGQTTELLSLEIQETKQEPWNFQSREDPFTALALKYENASRPEIAFNIDGHFAVAESYGPSGGILDTQSLQLDLQLKDKPYGLSLGDVAHGFSLFPVNPSLKGLRGTYRSNLSEGKVRTSFFWGMNEAGWKDLLGNGAVGISSQELSSLSVYYERKGWDIEAHAAAGSAGPANEGKADWLGFELRSRFRERVRIQMGIAARGRTEDPMGQGTDRRLFRAETEWLVKETQAWNVRILSSFSRSEMSDAASNAVSSYQRISLGPRFSAGDAFLEYRTAHEQRYAEGVQPRLDVRSHSLQGSWHPEKWDFTGSAGWRSYESAGNVFFNDRTLTARTGTGVGPLKFWISGKVRDSRSWDISKRLWTTETGIKTTWDFQGMKFSPHLSLQKHSTRIRNVLKADSWLQMKLGCLFKSRSSELYLNFQSDAQSLDPWTLSEKQGPQLELTGRRYLFGSDANILSIVLRTERSSLEEFFPDEPVFEIRFLQQFS